MRRKIVDQLLRFRHLKIRKIKTRRYGTTNKTKCGARCRLAGEPATSRNNVLKQVAIFYIIAQLDGFPFPVGANEVNQQGITGVKMPAFIGLNAVQGGKIPFFQ